VSRFRPWPWRRCCRMGPPLGASPPMRMAASWSIPSGSPNTRLLWKLRGAMASSPQIAPAKPTAASSPRTRSSAPTGIGVARRSDRVKAGAARHRAERGCGLDPACPSRNWLPCGRHPVPPARDSGHPLKSDHPMKNLLTWKAPYKGGKAQRIPPSCRLFGWRHCGGILSALFRHTLTVRD
jgi:hypothetical protein